MPWPSLLAQGLKATTTMASPTTAKQRQVHMLFGLIRHTVDPNYVDLSDHDDIVRDIRQLYRNAGPAAPRVYEPAGCATC
ncbi:hypothetical protein ACWIG5_35785 [Streptomyces lydicus]